ncbi:hypothetical protein GGI09_000838 [Coemansia sp. S100]|nr:hypothetical protein LPJ71_005227 [Coemansia sp. S17]KAJ2085397.1 hypothetical protein GGI16_006798 [Coemansia sp. S142-1]KAJ2103105.1 hypothetical protein GGI09_000838 [Coemansia sp. S100]
MRYSATTLALLALFSASEAFDIIHSANLNCRAGPSTKGDIVKVYSLGDDVQIVCQITGERVSGTNIWDKTPDNCYVLDYYLSTGFSGIFMPLCNATSSGSSSSSKPTRSSTASTTATSTSRPSSSTTTSATSDGETSSQTSLSPESESSETESKSDNASDSSDSQSTSKNSAASGTRSPANSGPFVVALGGAIVACAFAGLGYW